MNVAMLNQNNSASVVLPPRMDDLAAWYRCPDVGVLSSKVRTLYDMSGSGAAATDELSEYPDYVTVAGKYNGYRVISFDNHTGEDDEAFIDTSVDFSALFGSESEGWYATPDFTFAGVFAKGAGSAGSEKVFEILGTGGGTTKVRFEVVSGGTRVTITGENGATEHVTYTQFTTTPQTYVLTLLGSTTIVALYIAGALVTWASGGTISGGSGTIRCNRLKLSPNFFGTFSEMLFWKNSHTSAEVTETLNYLRDKWNCS